jgi:hypothetical protein
MVFLGWGLKAPPYDQKGNDPLWEDWQHGVGLQIICLESLENLDESGLN